MLANGVTHDLDAKSETKRGVGGRVSWGNLSLWWKEGERCPANRVPLVAGD